MSTIVAQEHGNGVRNDPEAPEEDQPVRPVKPQYGVVTDAAAHVENDKERIDEHVRRQVVREVAHLLDAPAGLLVYAIVG